MAQHIQFQEVFLHGMVFKVGGNLIGVGVVGRVLDRAEVPNLIFLGNDHQAAGVLARGPADAHAARSQASLLGPGRRLAPFGQVFFHVAEGGFFRHGANGACPENVGFSEHFNTVGVGFCLIFSGEVQVDIRHLVAAEAQEGLKGDVEAVLFHLRAALGTHCVGKVRAAVISGRYIQFRVLAVRVGTAIVGLEGVDLGDAGHIGNNGGAHGASGTYQVAVLQRVLHQLLGGHIDHVVVAVDDVVQLRLHPFYKNLRGMVAVEAVELGVDQVFQVLHGVLDLRRKEVVGHRPQTFTHIRNAVRVLHHNLVGFLFAQVRKLRQHLVCGPEIQGHILVRVVKALGRQEDVPEDFVLRIQEMHVSCGNHRFSQFLTQPDNGSVVVSQVLVGFRLIFFICQHETVVGKGLDFQEVIEGGDPAQFVVALMVQDSLEKLSRLAGGADDEALPHGKQLGFWNSGDPAEVFEVGVGNEMIEVPQSNLIFCKEDNMSCLTVRNVPFCTEGHHGRVDGLQGMDVMVLFQLRHKLRHNEAAGHGVVARPVMVKVRQPQGVGDDVQLEFIQVGQKILGENQGICGSIVIGNALALAFGPDEACVKVRIVGNQHPVSHEGQEFRQDLFDFRCPKEHFLGDARELHNLPVQRPLRVHKGLEAVQLLAVFQKHRADFNDAVLAGGEACGLQVKSHKFLVKLHVLAAVDHDAVIYVIDVIPFTAIENFDILVGACHLGFGGGLHGIGEGLGHAVVCNGDGFVTPGGGGFDGVCRHRQGVHVGHGGVQVQLHPLFARRRILPLGHGARHHGVGLENHLIFKAVLNQSALDAEDRPHFHIFQYGLCLVGVHKAADADGIGVVRNVKFDDPGVALFEFFVVHLEDLALYNDGTQVQAQVLHGYGISPEGLSVEGVLRLGFLWLGLCLTGRCGHGLHYGGAHGFHGFKQRFSLQRLPGLHSNGYRHRKLLPELPFHGWNVLHQGLFAVCSQENGDVFSVSLPFGPCQGSSCHGVAADKEVHKLLIGDFGKRRSRVGRFQLQTPQAVKGRNVPLCLLDVENRNIGFRMDGHGHGPVFRV